MARFAACDAPIASLACSPASHTVAVGTELRNHTASILLWDVRSTPAPRARYDEAHSDDITALAWDAPRLLSASADGLVSLHDERFAVYGLGDNGESETRDFGDLRAALGCQYVAGVTPKTDGGGTILGVGAHECVAPL